MKLAAAVLAVLLAACSGDPEVATTLPYDPPAATPVNDQSTLARFDKLPSFSLPARIFVSPNLTQLERDTVRIEVAYMNRLAHDWCEMPLVFIDAADEGEYGDFAPEDCAEESMLFVSTTSHEELGDGLAGRAQTVDCRMNVRIAVPSGNFPFILLHELYHSITDDFHNDDPMSIMHSPIDPDAAFTPTDMDKMCRLAKHWSR